MQSVTIGSNGLRLEAAVHYPGGRSPSAAAVVCHPHPQRGGDMHNSVVGIIVRGLNAAGLLALTFNFRGVGGSAGSFDKGIGEQDDVRAALKYLRQCPTSRRWPGRLFVRRRHGSERRRCLSRAPRLIAVPTRQLEAPALNAYDGPVLFAAGSNDDQLP